MVRCQVGLPFVVRAAEQTAHATCGPRRRPGTPRVNEVTGSPVCGGRRHIGSDVELL